MNTESTYSRVASETLREWQRRYNTDCDCGPRNFCFNAAYGSGCPRSPREQETQRRRERQAVEEAQSQAEVQKALHTQQVKADMFDLIMTDPDLAALLIRKPELRERMLGGE